MSPPRNLHQLKGLQGILTYIRRFIANLSEACRPFSRIMKKGVNFVWDQAYDEAFEDIKQYLANPLVLAVPTPGKPFIIYARALDYSLGPTLAQNYDEGKEVAFYYLSRLWVGTKHNYLSVEKECLILMFAVEKLRHYIFRTRSTWCHGSST